jgi:hypothetical protein
MELNIFIYLKNRPYSYELVFRGYALILSFLQQNCRQVGCQVLHKNADVNKKDSEDDDDEDDDDDAVDNNNNKKKMNNKSGRIFGMFFDPFRPQLLKVGLDSLTMAETTNLSEPNSANSMIR